MSDYLRKRKIRYTVLEWAMRLVMALLILVGFPGACGGYECGNYDMLTCLLFLAVDVGIFFIALDFHSLAEEVIEMIEERSF